MIFLHILSAGSLGWLPICGNMTILLREKYQSGRFSGDRKK
jgi:hypothetical protein